MNIYKTKPNFLDVLCKNNVLLQFLTFLFQKILFPTLETTLYDIFVYVKNIFVYKQVYMS